MQRVMPKEAEKFRPTWSLRSRVPTPVEASAGREHFYSFTRDAWRTRGGEATKWLAGVSN
jgi:hypothetical protein